MSNKFYDDGHILVDETRYIVGNKTIPINSITAVEPIERVYPNKHVGTQIIREGYTIPDKRRWILWVIRLTPLIVVWLPLVVLAFFGDEKKHGVGDFFAVAFLAALWALPVYFLLRFTLGLFYRPAEYVPPVEEDVYESVPSTYYVRLTTASGANDSYHSSDKNKISNIIDAINNAIIARG